MPELGQKRKCLDGAILPDMKFRRMRGKVPKKQQRALALVPLPSKSGIKDEPQVDLKLLPPGTFTDYLRLLRQKHPREKLSLKLFLKVWGQSFAHRLGIGPPSQHSTCGICKKHKMLLERISNERARAGQMQEYVRHLKRTYADRVCYWTSPATSSRVICSKEFQTFARPALDMSTIITHGHNCVIAVSGPHLKKDASWVVDLLSHAIHRLAGKYNVREAEFIVQSDNCGKETKNNVLLHFCGLMTALKKIYRIEMRFLQTAHTHEDVDQYFSAVATHIESCPELHLPRDFVDCLNQFGRQDPYSMHAAADYLESMADQSVERAPPLEVHRCFAAPGPSVGLGTAGAPFKGRDLEAAPNQLKLRAERMKKIVLDRYRAKRKSFYRNKAVAQLWANGVGFDAALSIVGEAFDAVTYEA
ncbi:unnamed protein product [Durusdinium trenchii]|uniref:DUF7869 domain-containing protein n=1 Tax=Durusdinium trenchii TaxID=1381693 RepID=A0ABP0R2J3_9DINO